MCIGTFFVLRGGRRGGPVKEARTIYSLPPVVGDAPVVLILGSMPGVLSLARGEYYAHRRNDFWRLAAAALRREAPERYEERTAMLRDNRIALWDSAKSCVRVGSLDKNITDALPNDVDALLDEQPTITSVCFNGAASRNIFLRRFQMRADKRYILLPSSSPVPRRNIRSLADKLPAWLILRELLGLDPQAL